VSDLHEVRSAAELVAFGLSRTRIGDSVEYRHLVSRYEHDYDYQALVDTVAEGMTLRVVGCTDRAGIVLAAVGIGEDEDTGPLGGQRSPFLPLAGELQRIKVPARVRDRQLWTLALLAVAYSAYPTPEDRDDDTRLGQVEPVRVEEVLRHLCLELDQRVRGTVDPPANEPTLERLWRAYLATAETGTTTDSRALLSSAVSLIGRVCETLVQIGCLRTVRKSDPVTFQTTPRFQLQVRELAASPIWGELAVAYGRLTEDAL
jgi:hypothetical protein